MAGTDGDLLVAQTREERATGDGEPSLQHVRHRDVEVGATHGVVLVVEPHDRAGVVVLDVQHRQGVAQLVDHRQVWAFQNAHASFLDALP
ncbi:hypothetical protein [Amycolatopsis sp. FDAARGOS 1241]|uniref:hypothetical protein n=1 Tax=Amycolatopsis sp. FDAARGOS 1241 TaxID=2778070 RepID=UPI00351C09BB